MTQDSQTITADLKPCPFCGGEAKLTASSIKDDGRFALQLVECQTCCAENSARYDGHWRVPESEWRARLASDAAKAWNTRAAINQGQGND